MSGSAISCACHSVVKLLRAENARARRSTWSPARCARRSPTTCRACAQAIVADMPRRRLGLAQQRALADKLRAGHYGQALIMSRKWKAALAPWLAGIPVRTGFIGEMRFGLINDMRYGETQAAAHDRPDGRARLDARRSAAAGMAAAGVEGAGRERRALARGARPRARRAADRDAVAGRGRRRQGLAAAALRRACARAGEGRHRRSGCWAGRTRRRSPRRSPRPATGARDLTGNDLRNAILALAAADVVGHQRFRPDACLGGDRHADGRDLRADQPVALEAAQSGRRHPGAAGRRGRARARAQRRQQGGRATAAPPMFRSTTVLARACATCSRK